MPRPQELIATVVRDLEREVPALARLKLAVRLELRGRGDVQVFRVRMPAPEVTKGEPDDAPPGTRLAVKDILDTAGIRTTYGSIVFRDHVPDRTAESVLRLEAAGYS